MKGAGRPAGSRTIGSWDGGLAANLRRGHAMYVVAALLFLVWLLGVWPLPGAPFLPFVAIGLAMFKAMTD